MRRAKLFKNGQSQSVRLPKEFRFIQLKHGWLGEWPILLV